ncbi:MAG TPA: hypothetical protein VLG49_05865, partial [Rhabdochlamydiaceae bacterium]|nr:hypothetical protein [Rhabdochlamydiaceae bacterium]
MGIKEVTPQNNYCAALDALFNRTLEKEQGPFHKAIEVVFDYVQRKSEGRCTAVEVFDNAERAEMIQALFDKYRNGADLNTLCRDRFMEQITTHNDENKINLKFIYKTIVPGEIEWFSNKEELKDAPEVLLWLREFDATVMDPVVVSTQKQIFEKLPEEYQRKLANLRGGIGDYLIQAAVNKWLNKEQIALIIEAIQAKSWENTSQLRLHVLFSKEEIVP